MDHRKFKAPLARQNLAGRPRHKFAIIPRVKPKAIDLFSGCGGLTLGLTQAGFRVVGAVEIDPLAVETYKANHKRVVVWEKDISKIPAVEIMRRLKIEPGQLDLLAGCPPCQGFSTMTTLNGRIGQDKQNDLVFEFLRFVRAMRPKAVMLENVPKLAKNRRFKKLRDELQKLGYEINHAVLNAANYGVPQRRRRLILVAGQGKTIPFGSTTQRKRTVREFFAKLGRRAKNDPLHNLPEIRSDKVKQLIREIPHDGGSRLDLGKHRQLECHRKCDGFKDVYGRMAWNEVSPTITGGCCNPSKGRFLHPTKNRTITLREAALLQTFPPNYFFSLARGKFPAAQMIGNALPPEFIKRHAAQIRNHLR
jgi:DNA (cytosine-5)-methyltransferase 1